MNHIIYFLLFVIWVQSISAFSPLQKRAGFLKHQKQNSEYQKKRARDFETYKKSYVLYNDQKEDARKRRLALISKIRKLKKEEHKQQTLKQKWHNKQKILEQKALIAKQKYIQKRNTKKEQERKYFIPEFEGMF